MCDLKLNQKSIRVSDAVMRYIDDFNGVSFNDKLNNMVIYFMQSENDKKKEIKNLEARILEFNEKYASLLAVYDTCSDIIKYDFKSFEKYFDSVRNTLKNKAGEISVE